MISNIITIAFIVLVVAVIGLSVWRFLRRRKPQLLNQEYFQGHWTELQSLLKDKTQWAVAVCDADKLLDEALKKRHFRGRVMGERLVKAQRLLSDNDSVWFGHKLRTRLESEPDAKLKEDEVKQALVGIRQALKDLGALPR